MWLFIVGGKDSPVLPHPPNKMALLAAGGCALLALVVDYLQYMFGYLNVRKTLHEPVGPGGNYSYDNQSFTWKARDAAFVSKQILVIACVVALAVGVGTGFF